MKIRGLLVATFVLAALVGTLYWSNRHKPSETAQASLNTPPEILKLNQSDINKLGIKQKDAGEIALVKDAAGKWIITSPQPYGADQSAVTSMLSTLASLRSERLVEDKSSDLSQYGLADPALTVNVTTKNNKSDTLLIGDKTPTNIADYAKLATDPRIFTIATYTKTGLDKTLDDLRDKRLLPVDSDKITQIDLATKHQKIDFARDKTQWQIVKPESLRTDSFQVDDLARALTGARMDLTPGEDAKKDAAAFASGTMVGAAKITTPAGTEDLQVRKNKNDYFAKSSAVAGVYKVSESLGQSLDKNLDDFRNKKLFDFGYNDPEKIEMHDGSKTYFLTKGGEDWWSGNGKKFDIASAQELVDQIRELDASKFASSGFSAPIISIAVTSKKNKQTEKVLISKDGKDYIAKREDEPSLYVLEASTVKDMEKAANDLKLEAPSAAPAKK
jgi:hypothetical protein